MGNCLKCGKISKHYVLCANCLKELKEEAWEETKIEFKKQYQMDDYEKTSEIFRNACYEIGHNYCYEELTDDEYKEILFEQFAEFYFNKAISIKIKNMQTGKTLTPNDIDYGLFYW